VGIVNHQEEVLISSKLGSQRIIFFTGCQFEVEPQPNPEQIGGQGVDYMF
jgi:hypothetical protein